MKSLHGYFAGARQRAKRRKSPWNLLLLFVVMIGVAAIWFFGVRTILYLPPHHQSIPFRKIAGNDHYNLQIIGITLPLFVASIPWGMFIANLLLWFIPPARKTFDKEAEGYNGCSFKES